MFEGQPLPLVPLDVFESSIWIAVLGIVATIVLRIQFQREWALTIWTSYQIKRVWQRLADESARTGGTLTSHVMGLLAWGLMGSFWSLKEAESLESLNAWTGAGWGVLLGFITLFCRQAGGWIGAYITLEPDAIQRGFEVDRHMRNWQLWLFIAMLSVELYQFSGFDQRWDTWLHAVVLWWIWLGMKWVRQLQSILHKQLHFGWGIAYICTFEIGPAFWLFNQFG